MSNLVFTFAPTWLRVLKLDQLFFIETFPPPSGIGKGVCVGWGGRVGDASIVTWGSARPQTAAAFPEPHLSSSGIPGGSSAGSSCLSGSSAPSLSLPSRA